MKLTDDDLAQRAARGHEDAFVALYRRYQSPVYRFALHMTGNASMAEEATQETFVTWMRKPDVYDSRRGLFASFLFGVARNQVRRLMERDRLFTPIDDEMGGAHLVAEGQDVLADLTREQTIEAVRRAVQQLPASYREVVVLCDLEEFSYEQAASVLGCAVGTVRSRLHRGRAMLLERIQGKEDRREPVRGLRWVV